MKMTLMILLMAACAVAQMGPQEVTQARMDGMVQVDGMIRDTKARLLVIDERDARAKWQQAKEVYLAARAGRERAEALLGAELTPEGVGRAGVMQAARETRRHYRLAQDKFERALDLCDAAAAKWLEARQVDPRERKDLEVKLQRWEAEADRLRAMQKAVETDDEKAYTVDQAAGLVKNGLGMAPKEKP